MNTFDKIMTVVSPIGKSIKDIVANKEMFVDDEQKKATGSKDVAPTVSTEKVPLKVETASDKKKKMIMIVKILANFLIGLVCAILCWRVNTNTFLPLKLFFVLFAFLFFPFYLVYYVIVHVVVQKLRGPKSNNANVAVVSNASLFAMKPNVNTNTKMPNSYIASNSAMNK